MSDDKQNRNTRQKSMILEYLKDRQDTHVRAEDIIHDLNEGEERVGKTTVYRVLKSLETEGKIRKYTLSEKSPACYQCQEKTLPWMRVKQFFMVTAVNAAEKCRMEENMKIDSLIFDLDGTLWDSSEGIVATWALVLENYPEIHKKVTAEELASNFGLPLEQIARNMFPDQPESLRQQLMAECGEKENLYLAEHGGLLYPKLEETLRNLSEKYPLFIVSNCQDGYIQSFYSGNHTEKYFKDCECIGVTGKSKGENIRLVMERNGLKAPVYVGDTQGDADAAAQAGIPFIYAAYGFGQVKAFDAEIHTFEELLDIVE